MTRRKKLQVALPLKATNQASATMSLEAHQRPNQSLTQREMMNLYDK